MNEALNLKVSESENAMAQAQLEALGAQMDGLLAQIKRDRETSERLSEGAAAEHEHIRALQEETRDLISRFTRLRRANIMWKSIFDHARRLFDLMAEVGRLREEMIEVKAEQKASRAENAQITQNIRDIAHGLLHLKETEKLEREKLLLQLELELNKWERRLPPGEPKE